MKKISLKNIKDGLTRNELRNVKGGFGSGGSGECPIEVSYCAKKAVRIYMNGSYTTYCCS